jgi:hypothetical protein
MAERIELPQQPAGEPEQQLEKLYHYLYQTAEAINRNLDEIGGGALNDSEIKIMRNILEEGKDEDPVRMSMNEAETLKSLIIKTASWVQNRLEQYKMVLSGEYGASGAFGNYVRKTKLSVDITPTGIQQSYRLEDIIKGLKTYEINAKNYIKSGLLYMDGVLPVYGVAVGKDIVTFSEDGTETYNDGNKVAMFTADELSFWQNGYKATSYKANQIDFYAGGKNALTITPQTFALKNNGTTLLTNSGNTVQAAADVEVAENKKLKLNDAGDLLANGEPVITQMQTAINGKISQTSRYQSAQDIVDAAEDYVDGELVDYSTHTQTATAISDYVGNHAYGIVSGITIAAAGIDISGSQYVKIHTNGLDTANAVEIDKNGVGIYTGASVKVRTGGHFYVYSGGDFAVMNSTDSSNVLLMNKDGISVYSGGTILIDGGSVAVKSGNSNGILIDSSGIGVYTGADVMISGGSVTVKNGNNNGIVINSSGIGVYSGMDVLIDGGSVVVKSGNSNGIVIDSTGIGVYSGADVLINGGSVTVKSGNSNGIVIDSNGIGVYANLGVEIDGGSVVVKSGNTNGIVIDSNGIGVYANLGVEIDGGSVVVKSGNTNAVVLDSAGIGVYSGGAIDIENGADINVKNGGDINIQAGANLNISGGDLTIKSSGDFVVQSDGTFQLTSSLMEINGPNGYIDCKGQNGNGTWSINNDGYTFRETDGNDHVQRFQISKYNSPTLVLFRMQDENETAADGEMGIVMEHNVASKEIRIYRMANRGKIKLMVQKIDADEGEISYIDSDQEIYYNLLTQRSSRDIKHDIKPIEPAGERLDQLTPVSYKYNDDETEKVHHGMIYEDTVKVMPEICTISERDGSKGISYVEMIPFLLKEIQELRARVKALEGKEN